MSELTKIALTRFGDTALMSYLEISKKTRYYVTLIGYRGKL